MAARIPSLSLQPGPQYPAVNAQRGAGKVEEVDPSYGVQVELLTRLKSELKPGGITQECFALFSKLDPHVQFHAYQFLCPDSNDKQEIICKGMDLFLRDPSALSGKIEELLLYVEKRKIPSLEERTEVVSACLRSILPRGIHVLISKYAMERFDDEFFGPRQWISCWGATPVTFTKTLMELRCLVNQKLTSGAQAGKPVDQMDEVECANFLEGVAVWREENPEPTEQLYECLNRRVRPDDKLLAGFICAVTYMPQFVRKDGRILAVTARTLAVDLGPNPVRGQAAKLFDSIEVLTPEDANRTEPSCYFMMERDVAPNTRRKKPSVLIKEITSQGDKGWQLAECRNFIATVFSRLAWKGLVLYGGSTLSLVQGKSRAGDFLMSGCTDETSGLAVCDLKTDLEGDETIGSASSRKFTPLALGNGH